MIQPFLKTVPLFRELDDDELAQVLMVSLVKRWAAGTVILTEGAAGGQLHVIHQGQVRISKVVPGVGEEALTILSPGDFFGEVEGLMQSRPDLSAKFLWAFGRTLAGRLRDTNQRMASLLAISRAF